jgi:hypothetical protein
MPVERSVQTAVRAAEATLLDQLPLPERRAFLQALQTLNRGSG